MKHRLLHHMPGRTRIKLHTDLSPALIEATYRSIPGVCSAQFTHETKTILIHHSPSIRAHNLLCILKPMPIKNPSPIKTHKQELLFTLGAFMIDLIFPAKGLLGWKQLVRPGAVASIAASRSIISNGTTGLVQHRRPNADTLSTTAIFASLLKGSPRSALVVLFMSTLSEMITEFTAHQTRNYVRDMMNVDVPYVWKVSGDSEKKVSIEHVNEGDHIAVFEGEKISADGTVTKGIATVDESSITGEYIPRDVVTGETVYAGTIIKSGNIRLEVEKVGDDTTVSRIVQMIEDAQQQKAPIQSYADELSEKLVPLSFGLAGLIYLTTGNWNRVLNMLVIDFVCGIKLSTATAISASIGKAARRGALIKGGEYLENLSKIDTIILDKTGTITEGKPVVKNIIPYNGYTEVDILQYVASAEEHSSHPIAEAIMAEARERHLRIPDHDHDHIEQIVGHGVKALIEGKTILVGNKKLLIQEKVSTNSLTFLNKRAKSANTVYVAIDGDLAGVIVLDDQIRPGMKRTLHQVRRSGIDEVIMLTGDKNEVAKGVADSLRIDDYYAEVLPHEKAEFVKHYKAMGYNVMMVGDGINDAPALTYADIGATMGGKRTDIAVEASDLVLTSDHPLLLADVLDLSKRAMHTIKQNFTMTIVVNSAAILLGAFGLIAPIVGAAIHNAATIGVVMNSTKLLFQEERGQWKEPLPSSTTYLVDSA
ncbi:heavy metal translocating P-type ATPase [Pontibacillus sp. ALD_SL1]|uniref:heavy metal translocating P-type ATPase n=1 Tax=Pontibacillus sp. ALD_SL1 TaxID=2777185 RepID=UPI001A95C231|nr:heavy metal translocating P-type ATPase [Pontibacillus sp. ALD_SL1]QST01841.1 heavy metal translocating P-type ATPase [Pontibacillus sp. ALD_SL1]